MVVVEICFACVGRYSKRLFVYILLFWDVHALIWWWMIGNALFTLMTIWIDVEFVSFSYRYWVWIDPLKRSFAILKNLADDLCRKLMLQQVGLCARLYARGNPPNYTLTLCCFPLHLKEQVYTPSPVCAQGEGDSLKPLCKADRISVSLSKAFTLMQEENLDNFLTWVYQFLLILFPSFPTTWSRCVRRNISFAGTKRNT